MSVAQPFAIAGAKFHEPAFFYAQTAKNFREDSIFAGLAIHIVPIFNKFHLMVISILMDGWK